MMLRNDDQAWDECPDAESCELIHSFLELVDSMVRDIQDMPHYDNLAYQEYMRIYYDGGDPMAFKDYMDSMVKLAKGQDDGRY